MKLSEDEFFECPACGKRSWHPMDIRNRFCGACKVFFNKRGEPIPEDTFE